MISHLKTKGFKGFDINEDIHPKTLFYGKNRSGKSTRAAAIALTILGYIPFAAKVNKKPAEILNDFGQGKTLTTAIICNGVEFERHFSLSEKGSVSQRLRVDKKKFSATDFAVALSSAGGPKIIDVGDFMSLSDQKKIDALFDIFQPKANLKDLDNQIDKAKKLVNELQGQERTSTSVIQRLTKSKGEIELPAGSLAEVRAEIETLTKQVKDGQENLKQAEIELAQEDAAKKATAKEREKSQAKLDKAMEKNTVPFVAQDPKNQRIVDFASGKPSRLSDPGTAVENFKIFPDGTIEYPDGSKKFPTMHLAKNETVAASIQKILDALNDSGCAICAAAIIAKVELKKYSVKKEVAA